MRGLEGGSSQFEQHNLRAGGLARVKGVSADPPVFSFWEPALFRLTIVDAEPDRISEITCIFRD